ncbi:MAG: hypothetical protein ACRDO7_11260 [Nocardioidaceae bacterium]
MPAPTDRPPTEPIREPIHIPWIWVAIVLVVLAGVPLYLPAGAIDPIWLGVPFWLIISVVAAVAMSAVICLVCLRWWSLAEPQETAAARSGSSPTIGADD